MRISLETLQLLDAIDLKGSFAAAAEVLHRVPSAVTHAVRKLETDLGIQIFERQGRRSILTEAGRMLLEEGRVLLQAAGDLERRVCRVATGWETELRIAVDLVIDPADLFPLFGQFYKVHDGTRLRISNEVLGGCWDALATGRADLAIGANGDPPPGLRVQTAPIGRVSFSFAVAPHHGLADAVEPLSLTELAGYRVIALADTSRQLAGREAGLTPGPDTLTVADLNAKLAAQRAGLGIGHLPKAIATREAAAGRLVVKRLRDPDPPMPIHLAWRHEHSGRALSWFIDRLNTPQWRRRLSG